MITFLDLVWTTRVMTAYVELLSKERSHFPKERQRSYRYVNFPPPFHHFLPMRPINVWGCRPSGLQRTTCWNLWVRVSARSTWARKVQPFSFVFLRFSCAFRWFFFLFLRFVVLLVLLLVVHHINRSRPNHIDKTKSGSWSAGQGNKLRKIN